MPSRGHLVLLPAALLLACGSSTGSRYSGNAIAGGAHAHASEMGRPVHWSYEEQDGPSRWAQLSPAYRMCGAGKAQSPIDLGAASPSGSNPLRIDYESAAVRISHNEQALDVLDNGHTIQVTLDRGSAIFEGGRSFELVQYHFHVPSEHTVDGHAYDMEMHFVHKSASGEVAVIGILIREGSHNEAFESIRANIPSQPGESRHLEKVSIDIEGFLPRADRYYRYEGSLTTPPCSEVVHWFIPTEAIEFSRVQIEAFRSIFDHNARPTQPRHGREVAVLEGAAISNR